MSAPVRAFQQGSVMLVTRPVKQEGKNRLLRQACARNTSAELQFEDRLAGPSTARVRLLSIDAEQIYMDRPQSTGRVLQLRAKQPIVVYFLLNGTRYAFRSRITRPQCYVQLSADQQVPGTAASLPSHVRPQQRRGDFRVSLVGRENLNAAVHAGTAENGGAAPIDAPRYAAQLLNISASGVAALFEGPGTRRWRTGDVFFLSFQLPGVDAPFVTMTELKHFRRIHEGLSTVAGFKFLPWTVVPTNSYVRRITRFIAAQQRCQLRRRK